MEAGKSFNRWPRGVFRPTDLSSRHFSSLDCNKCTTSAKAPTSTCASAAARCRSAGIAERRQGLSVLPSGGTGRRHMFVAHPPSGATEHLAVSRWFPSHRLPAQARSAMVKSDHCNPERLRAGIRGPKNKSSSPNWLKPTIRVRPMSRAKRSALRRNASVRAASLWSSVSLAPNVCPAQAACPGGTAGNARSGTHRTRVFGQTL